MQFLASLTFKGGGMNTEECCNHNCNQGRDCPRRNLSKEITEGFKALETMRNNEPVAWTDGKGNYFDKRSFFPFDDLIPLYTNSAKELTDEEVWKLWVKHLSDDITVFARAILRKANAK
jgi:hypothetical protein